MTIGMFARAFLNPPRNRIPASAAHRCGYQPPRLTPVCTRRMYPLALAPSAILAQVDGEGALEDF
jgi:hypothetical protein